MMTKRNFIGLLLVVLISLVSGCTTPTAAPTPDMAGTLAVNVAVAQTVAVVQTSAAQTVTASVPTITNTIDPVTLYTATSQFTPTPEDTLLTLSRDTYCRTSTSSQAPSVTLLKAGETVKVIAKDPNDTSYYVAVPNKIDEYCWLWGEYATLNNEQAAVQVYTPRPLPTPTNTPAPKIAFSVSYVGMENCGVDYYFRFLIKNTGNFTWQAVTINLYDTATTVSTGHASTTFTDSTGCVTGLVQNDLTTGESSYVAAYNAGQFTYDPSDHNIIATISLCRNDSFQGCDPITTTFTP